MPDRTTPLLNDFGLAFHHLGLAVKKPEAAMLFLKALHYTIGKFVFDPLQKVNLAMAMHDVMPDVEIIWPANEEGPLDGMLKQHGDGLVYHVCYTSQDLTASLECISQSGIRVLCVAPPKEAVLFGGKSVSFYMIAGMGLIEIIEETTKNR